MMAMSKKNKQLMQTIFLIVNLSLLVLFFQNCGNFIGQNQESPTSESAGLKN